MEVRRIALRMYTEIAITSLLLLLSFAWPAVSVSADCSCPIVTRDDIIDYAKSGVGSRYVWGGDQWDPANRSWRGADCSGFVAKALMVPKKVGYRTSLGHPYNTASFYYNSYHWYAISRSSVKRGDFLVYRSSGSGHVVLFDRGDSWGQAVVYEAGGTATGISHHTRYLSSAYKARRRHHLLDEMPQMLVSKKITNGSYIPGLPAAWIAKPVFIDKADSYNDVFITNAHNEQGNKTLSFYNSSTGLSVSNVLSPYEGQMFNARQVPGSGSLRNSWVTITSDTPTMASTLSSNGSYHQSIPQTWLYPRQYLDHFRTDKDAVLITNPSNLPASVKVRLYNNNKLIKTASVSMVARESKEVTWVNNKSVTSKAKNVFLKILSDRYIMASRKLSNGGYQHARPATLASRDIYFEQFNPKSEKLYITNTHYRSPTTVTIYLYNDAKRLYTTKRTIDALDVISVNLTGTSAARYSYTTVKIVSGKGKLFGSRRLTNGSYINAYQRSMLSQKVYLERFNPGLEMLYVSNIGIASFALKARYYHDGELIYTQQLRVRNKDIIGLNLQNSAINSYHRVYVILEAST